MKATYTINISYDNDYHQIIARNELELIECICEYLADWKPHGWVIDSITVRNQ